MQSLNTRKRTNETQKSIKRTTEINYTFPPSTDDSIRVCPSIPTSISASLACEIRRPAAAASGGDV